MGDGSRYRKGPEQGHMSQCGLHLRTAYPIRGLEFGKKQSGSSTRNAVAPELFRNADEEDHERSNIDSGDRRTKESPDLCMKTASLA